MIDAYLEGTTVETLKQNAEREMRESLRELRPEEAAVIGLLQQRLAPTGYLAIVLVTAASIGAVHTARRWPPPLPPAGPASR